ncbi:WD40 repeat domain-containing protein [Helicobacter sp. MIT 05-5293]|uniref:nitrate reductase n=1 Tax=Helicobacter sp. MIT 05-5293 TaxID=1548149 RepID=UPI00051D9BCB|nr:nitrate reductase [Helicobacter sp. MIT 05-5293]TLD81767.1 WD40 repeat domain-containing protein [Helicobacter sp. MIT 05-5293]
MRAIALCLFLILPLWAKSYILSSTEQQNIPIEGIITHISVFKNRFFVGNATGHIEIFELDISHKARKIRTITLPMIKDYFGDERAPQVFHITTFDGQNLFVLSESSKGKKSIVYINLAEEILPSIIYETPLSPKKILALDAKHLLVGFLSNEIGVFDLSTQSFLYLSHPSTAGFSDMSLNESFIFSTDESGVVNVLDVKNGNTLSRIDSINKDNNYQIASARDKILTAGQDRQMAIYTFKPTPHFSLQNAQAIKSDFLIYAVGISPNATLGAYSKNEQNDIGIVDLENLAEILTLKGSTSLINTLVFIDEYTLISGSDNQQLIIWHLKPHLTKDK